MEGLKSKLVYKFFVLAFLIGVICTLDWVRCQPALVGAAHLMSVVNLSIEIAGFDLKIKMVTSLSTFTLNVGGQRIVLCSELVERGQS